MVKGSIEVIGFDAQAPFDRCRIATERLAPAQEGLDLRAEL